MKIKYLFLVYIFALTVFTSLTIILDIPGNYTQSHFIYPDANSYMVAAKMLYNQHFSVHYIRPIGWPVILGLPYLFDAAASNQVLLTFSTLLNLLFWLGSIYYLYQIVLALTNRKTAFYTTVIFIFLLSNILLIYQSMTEGLFVFLLILFAYHYQRYTESKNSKYLIYCCLFMFYSAITRPANYYPAIITLVLALVASRKQLKHAITIVALFALTIGLQCYLMQRTYDKPTVSFIKNHTAYYYLFARAEFLSEPAKWNNDYERFYQQRESETYALARQDSALNQGKSVWPYLDKRYKENISYNMKAHFPNVFLQLVYNIFENSTTGSNLPGMLKNTSGNPAFEPVKSAIQSITRYENIIMTLMIFINWAFLIPLVFNKNYRNNTTFRTILLLQLLCSYFLSTSGISYWQGDRFNYVFAPLTLIVSAYLIYQRTNAKNRDTARAVTA